MSQKRLLLLAQSFVSEKVRQYFLDSLPDMPEKLSVVIITTASVEWKERNWSAVAAQRFFLEAGFAKVDFLDIEFEDPQKLEKYPVIYLSGGSPFYLLLHLKRTGADKILKVLFEKGTYLIGGSAGAVIFCPDIRIVTFFEPDYDKFQLEDLSALGCVPFAILPHANRYRQEIDHFDDYVKKVRQSIGYDILSVDDDEGILITREGITRI